MRSNYIYSYRGIINVVVILQIITKTQCLLDFTCVVNHARVSPNNDLHIDGYMSGDDTGSLVVYSKGPHTGISGLAPGTFVRRKPRTLIIPKKGGAQRVGLYLCRALKAVLGEKGWYNEEEKFLVILLNKELDVVPWQLSQSISTGESVTLGVDTDLRVVGWIRNSRYALHGYNGLPNWFNRKSGTINNATTKDGGIYETTDYNRRKLGKHAISQLIVRACAAKIWGDKCQYNCVDCYNGGICDERSGECVCPPGFTGENCETVKGYNHFAQDGKLKCSETDNDGCRGKLFCLPHPYGCSCGAGYYGLDCDQDCQSGFYGAGCKLECHCATGVTCAADTGICDGDCRPGWRGVNCQEPGEAEETYDLGEDYSGEYSYSASLFSSWAGSASADEAEESAAATTAEEAEEPVDTAEEAEESVDTAEEAEESADEADDTAEEAEESADEAVDTAEEADEYEDEGQEEKETAEEEEEEASVDEAEEPVNAVEEAEEPVDTAENAEEYVDEAEEPVDAAEEADEYADEAEEPVDAAEDADEYEDEAEEEEETAENAEEYADEAEEPVDAAEDADEYEDEAEEEEDTAEEADEYGDEAEEPVDAAEEYEDEAEEPVDTAEEYAEEEAEEPEDTAEESAAEEPVDRAEEAEESAAATTAEEEEEETEEYAAGSVEESVGSA